MLVVLGEYGYLNIDIPPLWLAYLGDPSDSGTLLCSYILLLGSSDCNVLGTYKILKFYSQFYCHIAS